MSRRTMGSRLVLRLTRYAAARLPSDAPGITMAGLVAGFAGMAYAGMLIGFARAIFNALAVSILGFSITLNVYLLIDTFAG